MEAEFPRDARQVKINRIEPAPAEFFVACNLVRNARIQQSPGNDALREFQAAGPVHAVKIRVRMQPRIDRPHYVVRMLFCIGGKRQCREMLEPAGLPHILDIADYGSIADVQRTGETDLDLPSVSVIPMPIELEAQGKLDIEQSNALHSRCAIVQLNGVRSGDERTPMGSGHCRGLFPMRPVTRQRRSRTGPPYDFSRPHRSPPRKVPAHVQKSSSTTARRQVSLSGG